MFGAWPLFPNGICWKGQWVVVVISIFVRPRISVSIMPSLHPLQLHQFLNHEKKNTSQSFIHFRDAFRISLGFPMSQHQHPNVYQRFQQGLKGPTVRFVRTLRLPFKAKTLHKTFLKSRKASDSRFLFHHSFLDQLVLTKCDGKNNSLVWSFANTYTSTNGLPCLGKHYLILGRNIITLWCHRNVACM